MSSHCNRWLLFSKASWSTFHAVSSGISVSITRLNASKRNFTVELDEPLRNWTTSSKRRKKEKSIRVVFNNIVLPIFSSYHIFLKANRTNVDEEKFEGISVWKRYRKNEEGKKKTWDSEIFSVSKMLVNRLRKPLILNIPFRELRWNFPSWLLAATTNHRFLLLLSISIYRYCTEIKSCASDGILYERQRVRRVQQPSGSAATHTV